MTLSCGIDFGTSNSTVAVARGGGEIALVPVEGEAWVDIDCATGKVAVTNAQEK